MNLGLLGYGKMGREIESLLSGTEHKILIKFNSKENFENFHNPEILSQVDVFIDFSNASAFLKSFEYVSKLGKKMVVGTTGWYDKIDYVKRVVEESGIGFIYASNFSIGMNIVFKLIEFASEIFNEYREYDVFIEEIHHAQKLDSPSGTALKIAEIILKEIERKSELLMTKPEGKISPNQLQLVSVRSGSFFGIHAVTFDSIFDTIEIRHTSKGRSGYALGAIKAAEFIVDKRGFYKFEDIIFKNNRRLGR